MPTNPRSSGLAPFGAGVIRRLWPHRHDSPLARETVRGSIRDARLWLAWLRTIEARR